jgi:hypothetical protein
MSFDHGAARRGEAALRRLLLLRPQAVPLCVRLVVAAAALAAAEHVHAAAHVDLLLLLRSAGMTGRG